MAKASVEIKNAIRNLQINRPFDLRGQGQVSLRPPEGTFSQKDNPPSEVPKKEKAHNDVSQTECPNTEDTQNESGFVEEPVKTSELFKSTEIQGPQIQYDQNEKPQNEKGAPSKQESSAPNLRKEDPQNEGEIKKSTELTESKNLSLSR